MAEVKDAKVAFVNKATKVEAALAAPGVASNPPKMAGDLAVEDAFARQTYAKAQQKLEQQIKEEESK